MEQFYEYIFTGSFGEYNLERMEMIEDFFANVGKKNKFFDSETYEAVIMFLIERNNITQAREILFTAREMFHDNVVYRALKVIIELKEDHRPGPARRPRGAVRGGGGRRGNRCGK